jgi:hypothetical protein
MTEDIQSLTEECRKQATLYRAIDALHKVVLDFDRQLSKQKGGLWHSLAQNRNKLQDLIEGWPKETP